MLRDGTVEVEATWCGVEGVGSDAGRDEQCQKLHRKLKRIVKARGALDAEEAEALREAERLRMWRHFGYGSLLEYMEMEMGYTPRAALERLRVAKAIVELPVIAEAMAQGDLSFSAGRELTRVATPETEQQWLEAANDKNLRQIEEMVSGHKPGDTPDDPVDPKLRKRRLRYDDIAEETYALLREARQLLERELGERLDDDTFLRSLARLVVDGARSPERTHSPYQIAVTVCAQCKRGWQDGGGVTVEMAPDKLETALCDARHIGAIDEAVTRVTGTGAAASGAGRAAIGTDGAAGDAGGAGRAASGTDAPASGTGRAASGTDGAASSTSKTGALVVASRGSLVSGVGRVAAPPATKRAKSDIPPALRRKVLARDHGRCRVPWCRSSRNVDCHHLEPVSQGGQHTEENILSLCESHHIANHAGTLIIEGTASNATFRRRETSAFAIVERVEDTRRALASLGFKKHEVAAAIEQTRTHVGTAELSLEQWIKIALTYCPKPLAR